MHSTVFIDTIIVLLITLSKAIFLYYYFLQNAKPFLNDKLWWYRMHGTCFPTPIKSFQQEFRYAILPMMLDVICVLFSFASLVACILWNCLLAVAKEQITHLTDEIALKFEDNVAQQVYLQFNFSLCSINGYMAIICCNWFIHVLLTGLWRSYVVIDLFLISFAYLINTSTQLNKKLYLSTLSP